MSEFYNLVKKLQVYADKLGVIVSGNKAQPGSVSYEVQNELAMINALANSRFTFKTHSDFLTNLPQPVNGNYPFAEIWGDDNKNLNGLYAHNGVQWEKTTYDTLELVKWRAICE